jgi:fucose permease
MNFLHFFFGLGAVAGPVLATLCINYFKMWRLTFGIVALFPVIVSVILLPLSIQRKQEETDNTNTAKTPYKEPFLWLAGISIFLYVGIETSMYGWCSTFWSENFSNDIIPASLISTIFWVALTIGRLICGKITDKAGFSTYITIAGLITMLSALIWYLFPSRIPTLLVNLAAGLAISGIYPTILASVTSIYPNDSGKVTALITIFASLAGCLMPSVIGRVADFYQITVLPIIVLMLSILLSLCTYLTWNVVLRHRSENLAEAVKAGNP